MIQCYVCGMTNYEWVRCETRFVLATVMMYLLSIDCLRLGDSTDLTSDSFCSLNCVLTRSAFKLTIRSYVITEWSSVWMCPLNENANSLFTLLVRKVKVTIRDAHKLWPTLMKEDTRRKPPTNVARGTLFMGKTNFSVRQIFVFPVR